MAKHQGFLRSSFAKFRLISRGRTNANRDPPIWSIDGATVTPLLQTVLRLETLQSINRCLVFKYPKRYLNRNYHGAKKDAFGAQGNIFLKSSPNVSDYSGFLEATTFFSDAVCWCQWVSYGGHCLSIHCVVFVTFKFCGEIAFNIIT